MDLDLCQSLRCKCGFGSHLHAPDSHLPKLEGRGAEEIVARILKTPMWKGATTRVEERTVLVWTDEKYPKQRLEARLCYIITRGAAEAVIFSPI